MIGTDRRGDIRASLLGSARWSLRSRLARGPDRQPPTSASFSETLFALKGQRRTHLVVNEKQKRVQYTAATPGASPWSP